MKERKNDCWLMAVNRRWTVSIHKDSKCNPETSCECVLIFNNVRELEAKEKVHILILQKTCYLVSAPGNTAQILLSCLFESVVFFSESLCEVFHAISLKFTKKQSKL